MLFLSFRYGSSHDDAEEAIESVCDNKNNEHNSIQYNTIVLYCIIQHNTIVLYCIENFWHTPV